MDLDRLEVFLRIVEAGSVTAAAEVVHLTQPAVSRSLRVLEEELGAKLFEREGRGLGLTAAGRALVPRARALVDGARAAEEEVRRVAARDWFDLRMGTVDSIATTLMPHVIAPLRRTFPGIDLKLRTGRTRSLLDELATDALDLVVVAWSGAPPAERTWRVAPYRMLYCGRVDLFPELEEVTDEAALLRFPLVEIEALPGQPTLIPRDARSFAIAGSMASAKALVLGGYGVGALLDFTLTAAERAMLATAHVQHDPECAVWVAAAGQRPGSRELEMEQVVVDALRAAIAQSAACSNEQ